MDDPKKIRDRARALREEKGRLEGALENAGTGEVRQLRLELARISEELIGCRRQLQELMPRHRIRHGGVTWAGKRDFQLDRAQYQAWYAERYAGDDDVPTTRELMAQALQESGKKLTEKQRAYFQAVAAGARVCDVADTVGVSRSTVCRTVKRARYHVKREATLRYQGKRWSEDGPLCLDLSRREHLEALMGVLTTKQQLYLYLYYGEWMSLREVGDLLEVDKSTVLRTIRRGLERLDALVGGSDVRLDGVEALEDLLMAHYNQLGPEDLAETRKDGLPPREERVGWKKRGKNRAPSARPLDWERDGRVMVAAGSGGGRLLAWLEERREDEDGPGFIRRLLTALLEKIRKRLKGGQR